MVLSIENKPELQAQFLESCDGSTRAIHLPILDPQKSRGSVNPDRLEWADISVDLGASNDNSFCYHGPYGVTSVLFSSVEEYREADRTGLGVHGYGEYGAVQTYSKLEVERLFSRLHGVVPEGDLKTNHAVMSGSGLAAITNLLLTVLEGQKPTIIAPDSVYGPLIRVVDERLKKLNPSIEIHTYSSRATGQEVEQLLGELQDVQQRDINLVYMEAPGSATFEIPDIEGIVDVARKRNIFTAIDNSWATHIGYKPLSYQKGPDVELFAITKYQNGFADVVGGMTVAKNIETRTELARTAQVFGTGAIDVQTCTRLFNRVQSLSERLDRHYESAKAIAQFFKRQSFVSEVLAPYLESSSDHKRFQEYFETGNGLFTLVFDPSVNDDVICDFVRNLNLFYTGESWGGPVSLVLPVTPKREHDKLPNGRMLRFSIGLEQSSDLLRDIEQAIEKTPALSQNGGTQSLECNSLILR